MHLTFTKQHKIKG